MPKFTLENHCTRAAQSPHGDCSQRVLKIEHPAVNKGNIFGQYFTFENIHHELLSIINRAVYLLNKIVCGLTVIGATAPELCQNVIFFLKKEDERIFCLCSAISAYLP